MWVRLHADQVKTSGEARDKRARERESERLWDAEVWKKDNHHVRLIEDMLPSDFRDRLIRALDQGKLSEKQIAMLERTHADKLLAERAVAPGKGSQVDVLVRVTRAAYDVTRGGQVFRIEFVAEAGWRGRIDTVSTGTVDASLRRRSDTVRVKGTIAWSTAHYAILNDPVQLTP